jgi:uncharacterized protein YciI
MHYLVLALDHTDDATPEKRRQLMPAHVERAKALKERGELQIGGPVLDENGKQIGSAQFVLFDTPDGIDRYVNEDPFTTGGVWNDVKVFKIDLQECRCVAQLRQVLCSPKGRPVDITGTVHGALQIGAKQ